MGDREGWGCERVSEAEHGEDGRARAQCLLNGPAFGRRALVS